nr:hypothetical protein [Enterococcus casseliflavus]
MVYGSILMLCFVAIGVLAQRGYLEIFVRRLERQTNMTELEKRKLAFFKHKIRNEHPLALLMVSGLFLLSLLLFTFPHFSLQTQVRRIEKESQQLKQGILHLQKEQMEGMQHLERIIDDLSQAQGVQRCHFVLQVADTPDTSFEQTIVRDAQGQWQVLDRKELVQASETGT